MSAKRILVLGATSLIAQHCCRLWAADGARLILAGRNKDQLDAITADLRIRGAGCAEFLVTDLVADAGDPALLSRAEEMAGGVIDTVLVAYGYMTDQTTTEADPDQLALTVAANYTSAVQWLMPLSAAFETRGSGTLAVITSVAGVRGRARNYTYGSAKGGLSTFLEGLRHRLARSGVKVIDVRPGPVDTPMISHEDRPPLTSAPEAVARVIVRAERTGQTLVYAPWYWRCIMLVIRHLPQAIFHRLKI